jgi:hypothetical protein
MRIRNNSPQYIGILYVTIGFLIFAVSLSGCIEMGVKDDTGNSIPPVDTPASSVLRPPAPSPPEIPISRQPPTIEPTPGPKWSGQPIVVGSVDPAKYNLSVHGNLPEVRGINLNDTQPIIDEMVTYAIINGTYSKTTDSIEIPFPYWQLVYTVDPWAETFRGSTSSKEAGVADSLGTEVFPTFSITVRDVANPNSTVRAITPAGGIDTNLWSHGTGYDPRPWIENFYQGTKDMNYFFVIDSHAIQSYEIDIMVPKRYLEKG